MIVHIDHLRSLLIVVLFVAFIGLCLWAWSSRRRADFEASAALPLEEDRYIADNEQEGA
jgi:cytochrome c oxidase cbb3-type subunit IV